MVDQYIPWSDKYSVGIRVIDNDHRDLFSIVNELHQATENNSSVTVMSEIINRLIKYVQGHFEREERLMAEYKYPGLSDHRIRHQDFVRLIFAARRIHIELPSRLDHKKLLLMLETWLKLHILKSDRKYLPFLQGDFGRRQSDLVDIPDEGVQSQKSALDPNNNVTLAVEVPASAVAIILRCARLLGAGGDGAKTLQDMAEPIASISLEEALLVAKDLLKNQPPSTPGAP